MFAQRYGVPMQDGYQKSQPDQRFNFQDRMGGGPGMRLSQLMAGHPMTGGNHPAMQMPGPMTGGPGQIQGGYDSGGINPGGMYTGYPQTGGQLPPQPMTGGVSYPPNPMLGGQMQPQGLTGLFSSYWPYPVG